MLATYLANIKSSGIYRFTFDKSELPGGTLQTARLVVGYSEKGPFNTVVYIKNASQFKETYGGISKKLERYGDFFHRTALQCLTKEPIYCLNLKPFKDEKVGCIKFNVSDTAITTSTAEVEDIFDRSRFWTLDPEKLDADGKYISICATDTSKCTNTVFMRPSDVRLGNGLNITLREWYNTYNGGEYPDYLSTVLDTTFVDDYIMDVYVFRGKFTDDMKTTTFNAYFNADGTLKDTVTLAAGKPKDTLELLAANESSGFIAKYTGSVIPYFKNTDGSYYSIDLKFNDDNSVHQMMMHLNEDYLSDDTIAGISLRGTLTGDVASAVLPGNTAAAKVSLTEAKEADNWNLTGGDSWAKDCITKYVFKNALTCKDNIITYSATDIPIKKGDYFLAAKGLVKVTDITTTDTATTITFTGHPAITSSNTIIKFKGKYTTLNSLTGIVLDGYTYTGMVPAKDKAWITGCLATLNDGGLYEALTNGTDVDYRYIVDTFEGVPGQSRSELSLLAKDKGNAFVISNFPSIKSFTNKHANFKVANVSMYHTLPGDDEGASFIAFYTPIKITDNDIKSTIPVAGLVSNLFMDKYTSRQPYYIVAGPNYGVISVTGLVGPEYNFTRDDLDVLEPYGVNALIYKPTRGTFINSNQTAKQSPVTALSKINVRELVIYLQDTIADMLQGYQWELNTSTLRDNIKAKADAICEKIMSNGGLYDYENVCDSSNNTDEVIDNEMVVLSTSIEPAKGAGKMVHELTIYSTGQMRSSISE